jgi:hypothetical protein
MKKPPPMNAYTKAYERGILRYGGPDKLYIDNGGEFLYKEVSHVEEKYPSISEFDDLLKEQIRLLADWNKSHINMESEQARKNTETILAFWKEFYD